MVFDRLPRMSLCPLPTPLEEMPALAGPMDLVRTAVFTTGQTVVFFHTGGTSGLFAYREGLAEEVG